MRKNLGLAADERFLLFASGGGGRRRQGPYAPDVFLAAAEQVANASSQLESQTNSQANSQRTALRCVVVMGPNFQGQLAATAPALIAVSALPGPEFVDLLAAAELAVIGGGSVIGQAVALGKLCVCAPAAADQPYRIARSVAAGLVIAAELDADAIATQTLALLDDVDAQQALRQVVAARGLTNGLPIAVQRLQSMLA